MNSTSPDDIPRSGVGRRPRAAKRFGAISTVSERFPPPLFLTVAHNGVAQDIEWRALFFVSRAVTIALRCGQSEAFLVGHAVSPFEHHQRFGVVIQQCQRTTDRAAW
jgi:hypothetical protein